MTTATKHANVPATYRQGDVFIVAVNSVPDNLERETGPIILANGEQTGHAHRVKHRRARMFKSADGVRYLRLPAPATVDHEEHDTIELPAGDYQIIRQREYSPEAIRNVAD